MDDSMPNLKWSVLTEEELSNREQPPSWHESYCQCGEDAIFDMTVEEGEVYLSCQKCDKQPGYEIPDELSTSEPIPVKVKFVAECNNLGGWHGMQRCEDGWWFEISLAK